MAAHDTDDDDSDETEAVQDADDPPEAVLANPGIDRHDFAGEWESVWEDVATDLPACRPSNPEDAGCSSATGTCSTAKSHGRARRGRGGARPVLVGARGLGGGRATARMSTAVTSCRRSRI